MKHSIQFQLCLMAVLLALSACRKTDLQDPPGGGSGAGSKAIAVAIDSLPGHTSPLHNLFAVFTVVNNQEQPVITDRKMPLSYNGKYVTDSIVLEHGGYKLGKLLVVNDSNITLFAAPLSGSAKAVLVPAPLPLAFSLPAQSLQLLSARVLKIDTADQPEQFGYPAGSFNKGGGNPGPEEPAQYFKIRVHPLISVGDVVYDSIPVSFTLTTWNISGQPTVLNTYLAAGVNELLVSKSAVKYQLRVSKWGESDELTVMRNEINEHTIYTLGGSRPAKKLSSVLTYIFQNGIYQPLTRTVYEHDNSGQVKTVIKQQRREDSSPYVAFTERLSYKNGKVEKIQKYNEHDSLVAETIFGYDQQGKITSINEKRGDDITNAEVSYTALPGKTGISGNYRISLLYQYSNRSFTSNYHKTVKGGVVVSDVFSSSNTYGEQGNYSYDFSINPYAHLNMPDLFLNHVSKHNIVQQQKTYIGNYPTFVPYNFSYSYHADGYPKELITDYKTYLTGAHAHRIKTVYNY